MTARTTLPLSFLGLLLFVGCAVATDQNSVPGGAMTSIPSSEGFVHSGSATSNTSSSSSSSSSSESKRVVGAGCMVGGCSSQLCVNETDEPVLSTCEFREVYSCYQIARCEKQTDGQCGWTQTDELKTCVANAN